MRERPLRAAAVTYSKAARSPRAVRNGLPGFRHYVRGAPRPAWADRNVAESLARHHMRRPAT